VRLVLLAQQDLPAQNLQSLVQQVRKAQLDQQAHKVFKE
jgi:hypothetical protein